MRIAAPPTTDPCFYGIDTPERDKLLASRYDVAGMAKFIGVDSLAFLSIDGLYRAMGLPRPRSRAAGLLRRLLHRRLSDRARRRDGRRGPPALAARRIGLRLAVMTAPLPAGSPGRPPRADHRRLARPRRRGGAGLCRAKARTACWSPAPWAASKSSTTRSRRWAATATLVPLDVTDGPGIDRLGAALYERFGRLDVLLGNAGILGMLSPIGHIDPDDLRAGDGGERHGQLAPDPLARSAAARAPTPAARSS